MTDPQPVPAADAGIEVRTYFVRSRNVLLALADFGDLYVDYYLHLADHQMRPAPAHDALLKRTLAAYVLHAATRPWNELSAWTLNFQDPLVNVFVVGDNETGDVTGRVFDENVRVLPENLFYADVVRGKQPKRRSTVPFTGSDPWAAVEMFYAQSEQRLARFFAPGEEAFVLALEHPDCDLDWLRGLSDPRLETLQASETVVLLERRIHRWRCGCNQPKIMQVLAPAFQAGPDELFGADETIEVRCPRCGARHAVTREALEAYVAGRSAGS